MFNKQYSQLKPFIIALFLLSALCSCGQEKHRRDNYFETFVEVKDSIDSIVVYKSAREMQTYHQGNKIKKYMVRHYVKPGITGLAQVKGYRGEIETDEDMINRIKYDVFYIENWSFAMDLKIIFQTVINIFKGEEKAY